MRALREYLAVCSIVTLGVLETITLLSSTATAGCLWAAASMFGVLYHASLWLVFLASLLWDICMIVGIKQEPAATKWAALDARLSTGCFGIKVRIHTSLSS